ncbi:MAG TPA: hypothetical protein VIC85_20425 [Ktedonobacterales bacterium]
MIILWLALLGAAAVTAIVVTARFVFMRGTMPPAGEAARWAAGILVANVMFDLLVLYFGMPALTGPYGGWQWLLWPLFLTGIVVLLGGGVAGGHNVLQTLAENAASGGRGFAPGYRRPRIVDARRGPATGASGIAAAGAFSLALVLVTAFVVNSLIVVSTTWFDPNAKALAHIPRITVERQSAPLPPTDVNHIVLVTQGVAAYLGQQVLAASNQNLGSTYNTEPDSYTLQSVNHHLYWIAPLVYNNLFANLSHMETPGFVSVDAEDPNVQPLLHTGYHLRYIPAAILNQDLLRHVYLSGYVDGNLVDPTLEVRDDWRPFFTISLMRPTRGFTGDVVSRVLLVDPQTGGIQAFDPRQVPPWVDRIIPADTVTDYLTWWGRYENAPWFNPSGSGQQSPANNTPELVYNSVDQPVWLEPMTSSSGNDNSSTGVILFDTRDNSGHFYQLTGIGVTNNVVATFKNNPHNLKNYDVGAVQLYQIFGIPTWVATFVQQTDFGETFQGVGIVDARHLNGADVIMATDKADALSAYAQSLAAGPGTGPSSSGQRVTVRGVVSRVSAATSNGTTTFYFLLEGQTHIFTASLALSAELPLVRPGDTIQGTFIDTGQTVVTLTTFDDQNIQVGTPVAAPAATATSTGAATP